MTKKTLIINGSPRINGDTAFLIKELREHLHGEIIELSAYRSKIAPCIDCRACWKKRGCAIKDDMEIIYNDDFDNVILASPIYFMTLPGQVLNIMSRFQPQFAAKQFLGDPIILSPKKAGLILTAGGHGNISGADHHIRVFFKMLNAGGYENHRVISANTDTLPAAQDKEAIQALPDLAKWLEE